MSRARFNALALVALISACSAGPSEPTGAGWLSTDARSYAATAIGSEDRYQRYMFTVVATFTNQGTAPVYLGRCYPTSPQPTYGVELAGGGKAAYDPIWACVGHDQQLAVAPGASRVDTLRLSGPNSFPNGGGRGLASIVGRMRLVYAVGGCGGEARCPLPADAGTSNVFDVRLAR
jgi:hypothetical protein